MYLCDIFILFHILFLKTCLCREDITDALARVEELGFDLELEVVQFFFWGVALQNEAGSAHTQSHTGVTWSPKQRDLAVCCLGSPAPLLILTYNPALAALSLENACDLVCDALEGQWGHLKDHMRGIAFSAVVVFTTVFTTGVGS